MQRGEQLAIACAMPVDFIGAARPAGTRQRGAIRKIRQPQAQPRVTRQLAHLAARWRIPQRHTARAITHRDALPIR